MKANNKGTHPACVWEREGQRCVCVCVGRGVDACTCVYRGCRGRSSTGFPEQIICELQPDRWLQLTTWRGMKEGEGVLWEVQWEAGSRKPRKMSTSPFPPPRWPGGGCEGGREQVLWNEAGDGRSLKEGRSAQSSMPKFPKCGLGTVTASTLSMTDLW